MARFLWRRLLAATAGLLVLPVVFAGCLWLRGGPPLLLVVLLCGLCVGLLSLVVLFRETLQIAADLDTITRALSGLSPPDLGSLHPRTAVGRSIAFDLNGLLEWVRGAVLEEERVRSQIEAAQQLRVGFVASMGHDLRAPLSSMLGFAELLLLDDTEQAQIQRNSVQVIRQRTLDLLTLIDEMLDWAKLEAHQLNPQQAPFPPSELLAAVVELAEQRSAGRGLSLATSCADDAPCVPLDHRLVPRAVVAVLGDAIRSASTVPISLRCERGAKGELVLFVQDPTLLIRREDQERFFEPFRPSYAPSGKRIAGLGLGAASAKAVCVAHGGDLAFESDPRLGTRFRLWFPG